MTVSRSLRMLRSALGRSPVTVDDVDLEDPLIGKYDVTVRDVDDPDLGFKPTTAIAPDTSLLTAWGFGEIKGDGFDEIEETIDLEEHVGEHVATLILDCDSWDYWIDWKVKP